ncbi:hypothetical protein OZH77_24290, partial [Escherichia coli]|uniref:hypothetical protein n=1 Tax=Escherichia coli TaxID=562 RepID=UPI002284E54C
IGIGISICSTNQTQSKNNTRDNLFHSRISSCYLNYDIFISLKIDANYQTKHNRTNQINPVNTQSAIFFLECLR